SPSDTTVQGEPHLYRSSSPQTWVAAQMAIPRRTATFGVSSIPRTFPKAGTLDAPYLYTETAERSSSEFRAFRPQCRDEVSGNSRNMHCNRFHVACEVDTLPVGKCNKKKPSARRQRTKYLLFDRLATPSVGTWAELIRRVNLSG